jgi:hypothetical protein
MFPLPDKSDMSASAAFHGRSLSLSLKPSKNGEEVPLFAKSDLL